MAVDNKARPESQDKVKGKENKRKRNDADGSQKNKIAPACYV